MPIISMFYGILVAIYYEDTGRHNKPHIHVRYQGKKASISIEDGTVLAGKFPPKQLRLEDFMEMLLDVIRVEPQKDNMLLLVFENHEKRMFDMNPYLEKKPFTKLKHLPLFMKATVAYGTVVWPGNIDIAPETLWDYSKRA